MFRGVAEQDSDDHDAAERQEELEWSVVFRLLHKDARPVQRSRVLSLRAPDMRG